MADILWEIEHWFVPGDVVEDDGDTFVECAYCGMDDGHKIHWSTPTWFTCLIATADAMADEAEAVAIGIVDAELGDGNLLDGLTPALLSYRRLRAQRGQD